MKKAAIYIILLFALIICACGWDYTPSDSQYFDYELIGRWVSKYTGELIIDYSYITINDYNGFYNHPLNNFTPGVRLKGYSVTGDTNDNKSKKGVFYIEDRGSLQDGIQYISYWEYDNKYNKQRFIRFQLEGYNDDILEKVDDVY